jgi:hypothetical protein
MQSAKPFRNFTFNLILILSIALPILLEGCSFKNSYGADTPDRVVEQYLLALEKKDEGLMLKLIPRKYSAEQAVEDKIAQLGGHKIQEYKVFYAKPKPVFWRANVQAFYIDDGGLRKTIDDTLTIVYEGGSILDLNKGRWYLLMGKNDVPTPEVQPAEPQTSPPERSR